MEASQPEKAAIDFLKYDQLPRMKLQRLLIRFNTASHVSSGIIHTASNSRYFCIEIWARSGSETRGITPVRILPTLEMVPSHDDQTVALSLD